ncbi:MAG TPA: pitrilysin family protein [Terriglobia bacterium]|nr:pitrilysin family protein [Terriglobia bacterium]
MSSLVIPSAFATEDVRRTVLDNGFVVLTKEVHTSPIVTAMIWYRVGSRNEELGQTGKSHFLEHMLFKGTDRFKKGQIDLITLKNGGGNNAFTSHDFTAYYFNFASDRWDIALEIEADRMVSCAFEPDEFEAEKKVVIEELKTGLDSPWGLLLQEEEAVAFKVHPYRNPIVGWLQDVERATAEEQQAYYRRYYRPNNAILVLTGDFDSDQVLAKVVRAFGSIPAGPPPPPMLLQEPPQRGERRLIVRWRSKVPRLAIAYHAPAIAQPDSYALQVLAVILSEGKASRLYQLMVEREQSVTFVSAEYGEAKDPTLFHIRAEARGDHSIEEIETGIYGELDRIAAEGVTPHELDRAKHQIEAHFILSRERTLDQAILLGQIETLLGIDYIDTYLQRLNAVTAAELAGVCRRYLNEDNRTVACLESDGSNGSNGSNGSEHTGEDESEAD